MKYGTIRAIPSHRYFSDSPHFTMFFMFYNIVHFVVHWQHKFADERRVLPPGFKLLVLVHATVAGNFMIYGNKIMALSLGSDRSSDFNWK